MSLRRGGCDVCRQINLDDVNVNFLGLKTDDERKRNYVANHHS